MKQVYAVLIDHGHDTEPKLLALLDLDEAKDLAKEVARNYNEKERAPVRVHTDRTYVFQNTCTIAVRRYRNPENTAKGIFA